jgi:hypothetical protein
MKPQPPEPSETDKEREILLKQFRAWLHLAITAKQTGQDQQLEAMAGPAERCVRMQEILHTLVRVRRQDSQAGRLAIEREHRARERVKENEKDERRKEWAKEWEPMRLHFKRSFMTDLFAQPDLTSQAMAAHEAESLLRYVKLDPSGPARSVAPDKPQSN